MKRLEWLMYISLALYVLPTYAVIDISMGNSHSCALKSNGKVVCWGDNSYGQSSPPSDSNNVQAISAGHIHTCALKSDGKVICWGRDNYGQSTPPSDLNNAQAISAGGFHTCVLKSDGKVVCWGYDILGQSTPPSDLNNIQAISAGNTYSCALKSDRKVVCWGDNSYGQSTPPNDLINVQAISAGRSHICALKSDGKVICWGSHSDGQSTPPSDLINVQAISAGGAHSCALKNDGKVVCWGYNYFGQSTPPSDLTNVQAISVGGFHTCALKNDGKVVCWGDNYNGQTTVPEEQQCCSYIDANNNLRCPSAFVLLTFEECRNMARNNGATTFKWGIVDQTTVNVCKINGCGDVQEYLGVTLNSFNASVLENNLVIQWNTASERDNLGMNLWCAQLYDGQFENITQLNSQLISSKAGLPNYGAVYSSANYPQVNAHLQSGVQHCVLEDVNSFGQCSLHCDQVGTVVIGDNSLSDMELNKLQVEAIALCHQYELEGTCVEQLLAPNQP